MLTSPNMSNNGPHDYKSHKANSIADPSLARMPRPSPRRSHQKAHKSSGWNGNCSWQLRCLRVPTMPSRQVTPDLQSHTVHQSDTVPWIGTLRPMWSIPYTFNRGKQILHSLHRWLLSNGMDLLSTFEGSYQGHKGLSNLQGHHRKCYWPQNTLFSLWQWARWVRQQIIQRLTCH